MTSSRIRLLICFITLSLLIGCMPSFATPTPIPPLDPNAIGTFMVQTAEAASAQTLAAMPTIPATATFTLTPRNTFTPEPSFTPATPFLFPTSTPYLQSQYYRVKHDAQLAMYNYESRTLDSNSESLRDQTPEVVPLFLQPKQTAGTGRTNLSGGWEVFVDALNDNDEGRIRYLKGTRSALFNTAGFPQLESLTMGGNVVTLGTIQGDWAQVNTLSGGPPSAATVNYVTRPDVIHKFVVVGWKRSTKSTILVNPPKGDIYWPLVSGRPLWIQMERLERFPALPMTVTVNKDVYIQSQPGPRVEDSGPQLSAGASTTITAYYPSASNMWGRLPTGGWIPLLLYPQYTTSWKMETIPPPP